MPFIRGMKSVRKISPHLSIGGSDVEATNGPDLDCNIGGLGRMFPRRYGNSYYAGTGFFRRHRVLCPDTFCVWLGVPDSGDCLRLGSCGYVGNTLHRGLGRRANLIAFGVGLGCTLAAVIMAKLAGNPNVSTIIFLLLFGFSPATTLLFFMKKMPSEGTGCPACGYDLRAHRAGQRCPECGAEIQAAEAGKIAREQRSSG